MTLQLSVSSPTSPEALRAHRIKLAFATSVGSKVSAIVLQALAFPLAIRALGPDKFGVYLTIASLLTWLAWSGIGIGPGLTKGLAFSAAHDDIEAEKKYFSSAFYLLLAIALPLVVMATLFSLYVPIDFLLGEKYLSYAGEIRQGLVAFCILAVLFVLGNIVDCAFAGYQEQHVNNVWGIVGNLMTAVMLVVVAYRWPTLLGVIIAIHGAILLSRMLGGFHLLAVSRPYLRPEWGRFDRQLIKELTFSGSSFFVAQLSVLFTQHLSVFLLGRMLGPDSVTEFSILLQLNLFAMSVILMVTQPLWPAVMDAMARQQQAWIRASYYKVTLFGLAFAGAYLVMMTLFGSAFVRLWIGQDLHIASMLFPLMGVYLVLSVWSTVNYTYLTGSNQLWWPAIALFVEGVLVLPLMMLLSDRLGVTGLALALCVSKLVLTAWLFPLMAGRSFLSKN